MYSDERYDEYVDMIDEVKKTVFIDEKSNIHAVYMFGFDNTLLVKFAMDELMAIVKRMDAADEPMVRVDKLYVYVAHNILRHVYDERSNDEKRSGRVPSVTALLGIVAAGGNQFTVHYRKSKSCSGVSSMGYDKSVFNDLPDNTPIIRFDLVETWADKNIFIPFINGEFRDATIFDNDIRDTAAELKFYSDQGIPVYTYAEYKKELSCESQL